MQVDEIWTEHRAYLTDLAFRMLGRIHDAEDVVQEAFARLVVADKDNIDEVRGWLVVVVSRLCLDQLRSGRVRRESLGLSRDEPDARPDPADRVTLDDNIRLALLVVLEQLSPAERAVFVLHDVFQFSFERVGEIVGRTPAACRQLASRARQHIETETSPTRFEPQTAEHQRVTAEFIAACAGGDLDRLVQLLDPDVGGDVELGDSFPTIPPRRGQMVVGRGLLGFYGPQTGSTLVSQPINGQPGVLAFQDGRLVGILAFTLRDGRIVDIHAIADPVKLTRISDRMNQWGNLR
jgi:RNA polymerase sigma-70 factor, ECF subfamily